MVITLKMKASTIAFYMQRIVDSPEAWEAIERKDESSFRKVCEKLRAPKKYVDSLKRIAFSEDPEPNQWPWY